MKDPVDHILRPRLPWRTGPGITECGLNAEKAPTMTRAEYDQRYKDLGRNRTMMMTCVTCSDTATRWASWDEDPRKALGREIDWEAGWRRTDRGFRLRDELQAIEALIAAHPEEFAAKVAEIEQRRAWLEQKKEKAERDAMTKARPKPPPGL